MPDYKNESACDPTWPNVSIHATESSFYGINYYYNTKLFTDNIA